MHTQVRNQSQMSDYAQLREADGCAKKVVYSAMYMLVYKGI